MPRRLAFLIIVRGRGQREILKNPRPAGSWRPLKCIFSGKGKAAASGQQSPVPASYWRRKKRPSTAGRKPRPCPFYVRKNQTGAVCGSYREQVSTTVPKSAILRFCPSRETCWGVPSPNPAMAACTAKIFPSGRPLFCENRPGNT